jgi:hypothetical protein
VRLFHLFIVSFFSRFQGREQGEENEKDVSSFFLILEDFSVDHKKQLKKRAIKRSAKNRVKEQAREKKMIAYQQRVDSTGQRILSEYHLNDVDIASIFKIGVQQQQQNDKLQDDIKRSKLSKTIQVTPYKKRINRYLHHDHEESAVPEEEVNVNDCSILSRSDMYFHCEHDLHVQESGFIFCFPVGENQITGAFIMQPYFYCSFSCAFFAMLRHHKSMPCRSAVEDQKFLFTKFLKCVYGIRSLVSLETASQSQ